MVKIGRGNGGGIQLQITDITGNEHIIILDNDGLRKLFFGLWDLIILQDIDKNQKKKIVVKNFLRETILAIDKVFNNTEIRLQYLALKRIIDDLIASYGKRQIALSDIYTYYARPIGDLQLRLIRLIFDEHGWVEADEESLTDYVGKSKKVWYKPVSIDEAELEYLGIKQKQEQQLQSQQQSQQQLQQQLQQPQQQPQQQGQEQQTQTAKQEQEQEQEQEVMKIPTITTIDDLQNQNKKQRDRDTEKRRRGRGRERERGRGRRGGRRKEEGGRRHTMTSQ